MHFLLFKFYAKKDVDECQRSHLNKCHEKATCINNIGSYNCTCLDGYFGNRTYCQGMIIELVPSSSLKRGRLLIGIKILKGFRKSLAAGYIKRNSSLLTHF